jgi:hypothetical protein
MLLSTVAVALLWQRRVNAKQFRRLNSPFAPCSSFSAAILPFLIALAV